MTGPKGPEAGVWVIAETTDLPTKFAKIVVTDDRGRYLLPDLPKASYNVWVRGYGLVDSPKTQTVAGKIVNLTAVPAPNPRAAAEYYPAGYWFSLMKVPDKSEFPGTGDTGNGISASMQTQAQWIRSLKSGGCTACHQIGTKGMREIPKELGTFASSVAAWDRRIQSGQAGGQMSAGLNNFGRRRALEMFADWTDRIAAGEVPPAPPRPRGIERNLVITQWDWADPKSYMHDSVTTDRRNPRLNPYGPIYGSLELSSDYVPVLDPVKHTASRIPLSVRDPNTPPTNPKMPAPSPYWGDEVIWTSKNNVHNPMLDEKNRLWLTSAVRPPDNPDVCKAGSTHPSAKLFPVNNASRHLQMYDPATKKLTHISTCFATHHLMFAEDANRTLWTSGGGQVIGWLNTKKFEETGDEMASQGWTALIVDTNGNGKARRVRRARSAGGSDEGQAHQLAVLRRVAGARRIDLGIVAGIPWRDHAAGSRLESAGNRVDGNLRTAGLVRSEGRRARVLAARDGRRPQRRRMGRAVQRAHGELRPPQVQGAVERREGHGTALPRRMDVLSRAASADERRDRRRQRRGELLHVGRSVRYVRPRRQHADQHRQCR